MKFYDPKVGNPLKDGRLFGELKDCVPIIGRAKRLSLKKGKNLTYMQNDLN